MLSTKATVCKARIEGTTSFDKNISYIIKYPNTVYCPCIMLQADDSRANTNPVPYQGQLEYRKETAKWYIRPRQSIKTMNVYTSGKNGNRRKKPRIPRKRLEIALPSSDHLRKHSSKALVP